MNNGKPALKPPPGRRSEAEVGAMLKSLDNPALSEWASEPAVEAMASAIPITVPMVVRGRAQKPTAQAAQQPDKEQGREATKQFALRLPISLHDRVNKLLDRIPRSSMHKILLAAAESYVSELEKTLK